MGQNMFRNKHGMSGAADQFVFFGLELGSNQRDNRVASRRRDRHPTPPRLIVLINQKAKCQVVHVEPQTPILVADEDNDTENAKVWVLPIQPKSE